MNIQIKDKVGFSEKEIWLLLGSYLENRKPAEGAFNFGLESHGALGIQIGKDDRFPIHLKQENYRQKKTSPIVIVIEKHSPLF